MSTQTKSRQGLKDYLLLLSSLPPADESRQAELIRLAASGDAAGIRELVEAWLPKVLALVAPRRGEALSFQELIAIGNCALIECVKSYRGKPAQFEAKVCSAVHEALDSALKMGA